MIYNSKHHSNPVGRYEAFCKFMENTETMSAGMITPEGEKRFVKDKTMKPAKPNYKMDPRGVDHATTGMAESFCKFMETFPYEEVGARAGTSGGEGNEQGVNGILPPLKLNSFVVKKNTAPKALDKSSANLKKLKTYSDLIGKDNIFTRDI